jgi:small subunit ribosomal protein S6
MLRNYETVFILNPVLSEEQTKETVSKFTSFLKEKGAKVVAEENWGLKKLAYPIEKKKSGFYFLVEFKGSTDLLSGLEVLLKRDERVMRFLSVALDKHALAYSEVRREKLNTKKEAK